MISMCILMRLGMVKLFATPHKHYNFPLLYPTSARVRFKGLNFIVLEAIAKNRNTPQSALYVAKKQPQACRIGKGLALPTVSFSNGLPL